jgi:TDG/mug DNA glycosylase family protein
LARHPAQQIQQKARGRRATAESSITYYLNIFQRAIIQLPLIPDHIPYAAGTIKITVMNDTMILPDLLQDDLDIVFCGTAAGKKSALRKAYYAGMGNLFYPALHRHGFTDRILLPEEFPLLLNYKIGLTDLVKYTFGLDKDLAKDDYDTDAFEDKIRQYQPKLVCFNGKTAAGKYLKIEDTKLICYGLQQKKIDHTLLFVAPSTSPRASVYWDEALWSQIKTHI